MLKQDTILTEEPHGAGPVVDVQTSVAHLRSILPLPIELSTGFTEGLQGRKRTPHNPRMRLPDHLLEADGWWPATALGRELGPR